MCWSRYTEIPPSTSRRLISAMASRSVPSGSEMASPSGPTWTCAPNVVPSSRSTRPVGVGALDLDLEGGPGEQLGDRSLADHLAAIDDGHRVAGALDLVEEMRRQHHGATLGHERHDHVAHVEHAPGVEAVHRLVEDQQLGIPEEAGGHAQPLAHAHGVLRHLVVGPMQDADALERRLDAALGRRLTRRGEDLQVLAAGQVAVEAGFVDDRPDPGQGHVTVPRDGVAEKGHRAGIGVGQAEQHPDQRGLAGAIGSEVAEGAAAGNEELDVVHGDVLAESLRQPVGLDGPLAPAAGHRRRVRARLRWSCSDPPFSSRRLMGPRWAPRIPGIVRGRSAGEPWRPHPFSRGASTSLRRPRLRQRPVTGSPIAGARRAAGAAGLARVSWPARPPRG